RQPAVVPIPEGAVAAMEPDRGDREATGPLVDRRSRVHAAMEPGHGDRDNLIHGWPSTRWMIRPQWNPVTETGMTRGCRVPTGGPGLAAMEPGRGDRDNLAAVGYQGLWSDWPQWSPVAGTGMTPTRPMRRRGADTTRNGARSRKPG